MKDLRVEALAGRHVRLEPFAPGRRDALARAYAADPEACRLATTNYGPDGFADWWEVRLGAHERGAEQQFIVLRGGEVIGSTSYLNLRPGHRGCEIGHTYYQPHARAGPVNPECKLLLLRHAFECGALRVELRTDALNSRSRAAILKLGALQEGVLRRHRVTWNGRIGDTVIFAITDVEWPEAKQRLEARLAALG